MVKEKVSILLSIYKPNAVYLEKQLRSLNEQTYENLELIVWNDCPEEAADRKLFEKTITAFEYKIYEEKVNLGYTGAFEKLVGLATGEFICFCDQDDIWLPEKIEKCITALKETGATVCVCDRSLMDENDKIYIESERKHSGWEKDRWKSGEDITAKAVFTAYATGMSIHARKKDVERFLPIPRQAAHDRWLMAVLSGIGRAEYVEQPLVCYRRYGANVSGTLVGIESKADYYALRADNSEVIAEFEKHFPNHRDLAQIKACNKARISGNPFRIFKYRKLFPNVYKYEMALALCPDFVFKRLSKKLFK